MTQTDPRDWARLTPFDPEQGTVIRQPPGEGAGYWAGAPGAMFDPVEGRFYLAYRLRRPRGVEPDRGAEVRIARSQDGVTFDDIWRATKDQLDSPSIERCALVREAADRWALFVSYVDPHDGRWRIDRVQASAPDRFDLATAQPALTAGSVGVEGIKDPFVFRVARLNHMIVSFAVADQPASPEALHGSADAYNTGLIRSATGLATSADGIAWTWEGPILAPQPGGWDSYCTRIGCLWHEPPVWMALYDGSAGVSENYEERCGLAYSADLRRFERVSRTGPWLTSSQGSGSVRYVDVLRLQETTYFYYEMSGFDHSHDLRVFRLEAR